ncbi:MAG TPA: monofunctional biosynthetic peptidoglycan transglycosylase [Vicinamibacteria bacterium]|nr:monofunctional biosynthetic peptidoglycan transglycosylase [Vicinamibacteria bacterium]
MKKLAAALLALVLTGAAYVWWGMPARADVTALARDNPARTAVMLQREEEARRAGRAVRTTHSWVPMGRISRHLVHAVVASEDQKFFGHEGVDWDAIKESVEVNRAQQRLARGGSTITQQLAKNLFFSTHKSLVRKGQELLVARWLEEDLGKRRILELYLNVIEWGEGVYGCQAAARRYYGRPCSDLGPHEAAGLAAMIPNPRRINPAVNPARHARAQRRVLWLMGNAGYLGRLDLGAEPPPVEVEEEDDDEGDEEVEPSPTVEPTPPPLEVPTPETPPPTEPTPTPPTGAAG